MSEATAACEPRATRRQRTAYVLLAVFLGAVWLATLSVRPLFNPDEGRYAEIPREMLVRGDWVIPHLDGLIYIEKPPLQYWMTALSFALFGQSEFAARLYTGLCGLACIALTAFAARRLWGGASAWRSAALLASMLLFVAIGQLLSLDMSLTCFTTASLVGFLLAQTDVKPTRWMLLAWVAAALGVMTKGVVAAAIPAAVLILYSLINRDAAVWRTLRLRWGIPVFLLLTVPWHWLAAARLGDFLQFFFVHEHLARYLTPEAHRAGPWWYFAAVFVAGCMPWTPSALRVLFTGWRATPGTFNPTLFLRVWLAFVLLFFSLSDSKLIPYILPALPATALLIAGMPQDALQRDLLRTALLSVAMGVGAALLALKLPALLAASPRAPQFLPLAAPLLKLAALFSLSGVLVLVQGTSNATRASVWLGAGWCVGALLLVRAASSASPIYSGVSLAAALPAETSDAPLYSVGTYDQSFTFYAKRTVTLVGYRGELDYGLRQEPQRAIPDVAQFVRQWEQQSEAFAIMEKNLFESLRTEGLPMRMLGQNADRVVVARR